MSSQLAFCPHCQSLLLTEREEEVFLKCPTCTYTGKLGGLHLLHGNRLKDSGLTTQLPYTTIFDSTTKRTTRVSCLNASCPSLDPAKWGTKTETGIVVQPDVIMINYTDPDRVSTYICRVCGHVFRP